MLDFLTERNLRKNSIEDKGAGSIDIFIDSLNNHPNLKRRDLILDALNFSCSLEYFHEGLSKESYLAHPIRVALLALKYIDFASSDSVILALLHNLYEVTKVKKKDLINNFGKEIHNSIEILTVNRDLQWNKQYKETFYKKINSSSLSTKIVKILDKFDNIFLINSNSDDAIREKYINEIRTYILPMTKLYLPIIYDDFSFACDKAEKYGFIQN